MEKNDEKEDLKENNDFSNEETDTNQSEQDGEKNYLEHMQRLQAEFDNYVKRTEKEKVGIIRMANEELITKLLSVLDNFELALKHNDDKGINMIYSELYTILEKKGVSPIKAKGVFDPQYHEVLIQEDGDKDGVIVAELQKGYMLGDKVIRAAKVKISKFKENENE